MYIVHELICVLCHIAYPDDLGVSAVVKFSRNGPERRSTPVSGVPPPEIAVPPPKGIVPPPGNGRSVAIWGKIIKLLPPEVRF